MNYSRRFNYKLTSMRCPLDAFEIFEVTADKWDDGVEIRPSVTPELINSLTNTQG